MKNNQFIISIIVVFVFLFELPVFSYANSFNGMGSIVFGIFLGIPSAIMLLIFIVVSAIFLHSQNISEYFRHVYKISGIILSFIGIFLYPVSAFLVETKGFVLVFFFWIPLLILGIVSLILLFKL